MILGLDSRVVGLTSSSAVRLRAVGADEALVAAFASGVVDWAVGSRRPPLARLGVRTMGSIAADLGSGGLWSLDRALVQVLGVTTRELGSLTDLELAGWLREALRRPPDDRQGVELTENE